LVAEHSTKRILKMYDNAVDAVKDVLVGNDPDDPDVVSGEVIN